MQERPQASHANGSGEGPSSPDPGGFTDLVEAVFRFAEDLSGALRRLLDVHSDRVRLTARRALFRIALRALVVLGAAAWIAIGAWQVLNGLSGGLAALAGDRPWVGQLLSGVLALLAVAVVVWLAPRVAASRELKRMEEKYADEPTDTDEGQPVAETEDARGVPRSPGAALDPRVGGSRPTGGD